MKDRANTPGEVNCIPQNEEKYITFNKSVYVGNIFDGETEKKIFFNLKFVDTMNFMQTSLEKLVNNISKNLFQHTSRCFSGDQLDLMLPKGVYPYDYMTDLVKLEEPNLPLKEASGT